MEQNHNEENLKNLDKLVSDVDSDKALEGQVKIIMRRMKGWKGNRHKYYVRDIMSAFKLDGSDYDELIEFLESSGIIDTFESTDGVVGKGFPRDVEDYFGENYISSYQGNKIVHYRFHQLGAEKVVELMLKNGYEVTRL